MKDPRYVQIAKNQRAIEIGSQYGHCPLARYVKARQQALKDIPHGFTLRHLTGTTFSFHKDGVIVRVLPCLAHGFALEISGECYEAEIGEVFSKWLRERV